MLANGWSSRVIRRKRCSGYRDARANRSPLLSDNSSRLELFYAASRSPTEAHMPKAMKTVGRWLGGVR